MKVAQICRLIFIKYYFLCIANAQSIPSLPQPATLSPQIQIGTPVPPASAMPAIPSIPGYSPERPRTGLEYHEQVERQWRAQQAEMRREIEEAEARAQLAQRKTVTLASYHRAAVELRQMLIGQAPISLTRAVYLVENAFLEDRLDSARYAQAIDSLIQDARSLALGTSNADWYAAIFRTLYDTVRVVNGKRIPRPRFRYDFEDYMGEQNWQQMFVVKLLITRSGNCHSLPLLYLILAQQLGIEAHLAFAPNHSFVRHRGQRGEWRNLELTTGNYITETSILASGFVKVEALRSGIYLKPLTKRELIAQCLVDLAQGYLWKLGPEDDFAQRLVDEAITAAPDNIHAWMLKAMLAQHHMNRLLAQHQIRTREAMLQHPAARAYHDQIVSLHQKIEALGYAAMPNAAYEDWLKSLNAAKASSATTR